MRFLLCASLALIGLLHVTATPAPAQVVRSTPGLVLATDGRYGACDVLLFTPDGTRLFACGDDKVVRRWIVEDAGFSSRKLAPLRWPVFREQRGSIFAMTLSPDADADSVAIAGFGQPTGAVYILDRYKGEVEQNLAKLPTAHPTWAIAYSPSGKHLVYGTEVGEVFMWDIGAKAKEATLLSGTRGEKTNRVRAIAFLSNDKSETRFVSVASDGKLRIGDVSQPDRAPRTLKIGFELPRLRAVAVSPDRRWLAGIGEWEQGTTVKNFERVEMVDLREALNGKDVRKSLQIPRGEGMVRVPQCLAFDHGGERLAAGCRVHNANEKSFYRELGGLVFTFDLKSGKPLPAVLDVGYRPDAVAFRPTPPKSPKEWRTQLATAGGNNHEVRLWNLTDKGTVMDVIESPGACLWSVSLSKPDKDGKVRYLAWKDRRANSPEHPNRWGAGEWRVFDLQKKSILGKRPGDFQPVEPIETVKVPGHDEPWKVVITQDAYLWRVVGPGSASVNLDDTRGLYLPNVNNIPRCYSFLPYKDRTGKAPVYLAVGHTWGVTLYECRPGQVSLARVMVGHEGEVMSLAPSEDGSVLVTASRDQTLAGWSLAPWPTQRELGATFQKSRDGKRLQVKEVSPGSPAWEGLNPMNGGEDDRCRLGEGDEIDFLFITDQGRVKRFYYDPLGKFDYYTKKFGLKTDKAEPLTLEQTLEKLAATQPNQEMIFFKTVDKQDVVKLTTVRQRPLWRFYPERLPEEKGLLVTKRGGAPPPMGRDWVIWRWRDYYYDTNSARADQYIGWQINAGNRKPEFYALERFRGTDDVVQRGERAGFHQPAKVWLLFSEGLGKPDKVIFPDIQPPDVKLEVLTKPDKANDLVVKITIRPRDKADKQKLSRVVNLWLNDFRFPVALKADANGNIEVPRQVIPRAELRRGPNRLTLQAYNVEGGRGQDQQVVEYNDGTEVKRTLYALVVGINDYSKVRGYGLGSLNCPRNDAAEMSKVLRQHDNSTLYQRVDIRYIQEQNATAAQIIKELRDLGTKAKPDDWLVVFLSGHGSAEKATADEYKPGSFFFLCADTDRTKPNTHLTSKMLYSALAEIRSAKMLILDCCHSGDVASNPLRDLTRDGVPSLILSACRNDQQANEPTKGKHGFFTQCILEAVSDSAQAQGKKRDKLLRASDLRAVILRRLPEILTNYKVDPEEQTPEFLPPELSSDPVFAKP